jgi:dihydroneopterin aldolase
MDTTTDSLPAPDTIFIRELRYQTRVGVYPWEREATQAVELDIDFDLPGRHAADSHELADTIDYSKVVARVREILDDHDAQLLEALAELIATTLLREFGMPRLRLSLAKLNLMPGVKKLGISIERRPGTAGQAPGTGSDARSDVGSGPAR